MIRKTFYLFSFLACAFSSKAQLLHFSSYEHAMQSINPALNGGFAGTFRAMGIARSQYNGGGVNGYSSVEAGVDLPIIRGIRPQDWVGVGMSMNQETMGTTRIRESYFRSGLAYHFSLNKKQTSYLSLGVQLNRYSSRINIITDLDNTRFIDYLKLKSKSNVDLTRVASLGSSGGAGGNNQGQNYQINDYVPGLAFTSNGKKTGVKLGLSVSNLFTDSIKIFVTNYQVPIKFIGFVQVRRSINKKLDIEPSLLFQTAGYARELLFHTKAAYKPNSEKNMRFLAGAGFRTGTFSAIWLAGVDYGNIRGTLSYDMPIGGFAAAPGIQNGIELGVTYLGILKKTPQPKPIILCPRI